MISTQIISKKKITCSAPGSLMIAGEHAVLHGKHALVGAVNQRVYVSVKTRDDDLIVIHSALGERKMPRNQIDASRPFHFIGAILQKYSASFASGFDLTVEADFPADVGLGSSSAISVAALAAIQTWLTGNFPEREELMRDAIEIIRAVQGGGSGADVAAAVWGGVLLYKATPQIMARYEELPPIALVYAGYKTPTPKVIKIVEKQRIQSKDNYEDLFSIIDASTIEADKALRNKDWIALGIALNKGQCLMEELGVCDKALTEIVATMSKMTNITGTKISGSGLGDCVLGIGTLDNVDWMYREIPVELSARGVEFEQRKI